MAEHIAKCLQCGSFEFAVVETLQWEGEVDDEGHLGCSRPSNEIESIRCVDCGELYTTDSFYDIYFS
jgi:hypothetical protein